MHARDVHSTLCEAVGAAGTLPQAPNAAPKSLCALPEDVARLRPQFMAEREDWDEARPEPR